MAIEKITLLAARKMAGLTQRDFAIACGVSEGTVSRWEKGMKEPTISQARKIGEINNQDVWFNIHDFYFCWNVSTKFFLVCCLTGRQNLSLFI